MIGYIRYDAGEVVVEMREHVITESEAAQAKTSTNAAQLARRALLAAVGRLRA